MILITVSGVGTALSCGARQYCARFAKQAPHDNAVPGAATRDTRAGAVRCSERRSELRPNPREGAKWLAVSIITRDWYSACMTLRVKVLEPFDARGIAAFHGAAGLLMAAPFWIADTGAGRLGIMTLAAFFARLIQIMYGCFWLGIPILLAIWLSRQCQRRRVLFWSGFAFGACWVAGQMLPILLWKGELGEWFTLPHLMILVSIGGAFYGVGYVGTNFTFRQLAYRIEEQDGELCWICAYRVGNPPISDRCSECGNPIHPSTRPKLRRPLKQFTKRHSRKLTATVLIFVAVVLIAAAIKQRAETQSFRTSFEGKPVRGAVVQIDLTAIPPRWIGGWEAKGRWRPISTEPTNALVVYYIPNPYGAQPSMQIQLTGLVDTGGLPVQAGATQPSHVT